MNQEIVQFLLEAGADVNQVDQDDETPLGIAINRRSAQIVRQLLDAGAKVHTVGRDLYYAVENGNKAIVGLLLNTKISVNYAPFTCTPLHEAAGKGNTVIARMLLQAGASPNLPSKHGTTPLLFAAKGGHEDTVQLLLAYGAQPPETAARELYPEAWNLIDKNADLIALQANTARELFRHIENKHGLPRDLSHLIRAFAELPAWVVSATEKRQSKLAEQLVNACQISDVETVKRLLRTGADARQANQDGTTPLELAGRLDKPSIRDLLLKYGACMASNGEIPDQALLAMLSQAHDPDRAQKLVRMHVQGDKDACLALFKQAIDSGNPVARIHIANAYYAIGWGKNQEKDFAALTEEQLESYRFSGRAFDTVRGMYSELNPDADYFQRKELVEQALEKNWLSKHLHKLLNNMITYLSSWRAF